VLLDLVHNAREAMPRGGTLTIETRVVTVDERNQALTGAERRGAYVVLSVADTGPGLEERALPRIFEPFFTGKEGALGLGLFTTERLVRGAGGHVRVESRRGDGATFHVYLPRATEAAEEPGPGWDSEQVPATATVLLVEDDVMVRELVRQVLELRRFRVLEAFTVAEALRISARHQDKIDLLVSDVMLPGEGGRALVKRLRERIPGLRVVLTSGASDERLALAAVRDEKTEFLPKPFAPDDLVDRVCSLLAAGRPRREEPDAA
jgi:two-component system cell cycle sensor histidine kinase/response regulator CckA